MSKTALDGDRWGMDYDMARLGQAVADARQAMGLSQRELGDLTGVNPDRISRIERATAAEASPRWNARGWVNLETALGWAIGSAKRVALGGEPVLAANVNYGTHFVDGDAQAIVAGPKAAREALAFELMRQAEQLLAEARRLRMQND